MAGGSTPSHMLRQTCCASSLVHVIQEVRSALSVRPWLAPMTTSWWAPVAKQYYLTFMETKDLDTTHRQ